MKCWTLILLLISTLAVGQSGYNYYKQADRVGSKNEKAFTYFKKAYYDHIWNWTKTGSDSAVYYLQLAIQEDSLYGAAYAFLGHVYKFKTYDGSDKDEFKNQKWYAEKAIKLNPTLGDAYTLMATVKWTEKDTVSALNYLRQAVRIEPDHVGNYIWLGMRLSTIPEKKDSAIYYFHKIMRIDPEYGQAYMKLASLYEEYGVYDSALYYYKKTIEHYENVKPRDLRMVDGYLFTAIVLKDNFKKYETAADYVKIFISEVKKTDFIVRDWYLMIAYGIIADCYKKMSEQEIQNLIQHNEIFIKENPTDFERTYQAIDSYLSLNNDSINLKYTLPLTKHLREVSTTQEQKDESFLLPIEIGKSYAHKGDSKMALTFLSDVSESIKTDTERKTFKEQLIKKDFDKLRDNKDFKKLSK